jgi:hypothetical protein
MEVAKGIVLIQMVVGIAPVILALDYILMDMLAKI